MYRNPIRLLAASLALAALGVSTAPITDDLQLGNGAGGLQGSITTDGTLGSVGVANILEWTFTSDGKAHFTIASPNPITCSPKDGLDDRCLTHGAVPYSSLVIPAGSWHILPAGKFAG